MFINKKYDHRRKNEYSVYLQFDRFVTVCYEWIFAIILLEIILHVYFVMDVN